MQFPHRFPDLLIDEAFCLPPLNQKTGTALQPGTGQTNQPILPTGQLKPNQPIETATTLFYTEGQRNAVLVIQTDQRFRKEVVPVSNPQAVLDWCLGNGTGLVFSRSIRDPQRN